jgi:hypothetical protein
MVTARITNRGGVGKVTVTAPVRTTIADPKYRPKPNVAINEIVGVDVATRQEDGDVLTFNAATGNYESSQLSNVNVNVKNINGGFF